MVENFVKRNRQYISSKRAPVKKHPKKASRPEYSYPSTCLDTAHCLRINYYVQKIGGHRSRWNSAQMNNRHPFQMYHFNFLNIE